MGCGKTTENSIVTSCWIWGWERVSRTMTLSERAELNALRDRYRAELKPEGNDEELVVEQVARSAWAIRLLERQEAEIFEAYMNPFMNARGRRSLAGVSTLRAHYATTMQAALRYFFTLSNREGRAMKKATTTNRGKRTR